MVNSMERAFQALKFVVMAPYESEISAEIDFEPGVILSKMGRCGESAQQPSSQVRHRSVRRGWS